MGCEIWGEGLSPEEEIGDHGRVGIHGQEERFVIAHPCFCSIMLASFGRDCLFGLICINKLGLFVQLKILAGDFGSLIKFQV